MLLLAAVQFVNILDFMMPSPLGPRFAAELGIPTASLGVVVSSYTVAAGATGLAGAFLLDRFDRRAALAVSLVGLAVGTAGAALATDLHSLVLARIVAGAFGGPASSLALAIVADAVPLARRGHALGTLMMAFSVASVLGVPAALVLADHGSWHTPFVVTGALCLLAALCVRFVLPPLHVPFSEASRGDGRSEMLASLRALASDPSIRLALVSGGLSALGAFMIVPNVAAFVQHNLGYPESLLSALYGVGGLASLLALRPLGRLVDRVGAFPVALVGALGHGVVCALLFVALAEPIAALCEQRVTAAGLTWSPGWLAVAVGFVLFMLTSNARNVAFGTLSSRVPPPLLRARYQSLASMVQHLGLAAGGLAGPTLLSSEPDGTLLGVERLTAASVLALLVVPFFMRTVEVQVDLRDGVVRGSLSTARGEST